MELLTRFTAALSDRYALEREIGRGGMAVVYLARDLRHDRQVAIKVLSENVASLLGVKRFLAEIGIAARLQHPHILPLLDSGEVDGVPYYVMPYVSGETLRQRLQRETQLPVDAAWQIARDVADALEHAHQQGIVHRDIKPENILLAGTQAIVADFGVARALTEAGGESLTESGIAIGTPRYMSPEQAAGSKVDGRSDIYALGCVLYEMLAGEPPFSGATPQAVMAKHVHEAPPPLRIVRPGLPDGVQEVIERALAKVPADRYGSCAEFRDRLETGTSSSRWRRATHIKWPRVALTSGLGVAALALVATRAPYEFLDPHRVVVYPLVVSSEADRVERVGEGMATVIGNALDGVGFLRWLDGWRWLDPAERDDVRALTDDRARAIARERGAAMYVDGRVVDRGDSLEVMMELYDVRGDSSVARTSAAGSRSESWRLALRAVSGLLPSLIPPGRRIDLSALDDVHPTAAAHFLQGESEYRRARFVDALEHYRTAVAADSAFALAALRGAQAASWKLRREEAAELVDVALESPKTLNTRELLFARGLDAYLAAKADSAVDYLRRALRIDPDWPDAWMALGEVFTHLLPREPSPDSQATVAFAEARRLDPEFSPPLFHLLETAIRKGEIDRADRLLRDFERSDPDSALAQHIEIMWHCVANGPESIDWRARVEGMRSAVQQAARSLTVGVYQPDCAERAWRALLEHDPSDGGFQRWGPVLGLQSLLVAQSRYDETRRLLDSATTVWSLPAEPLYLLDALAGADFESEAADWVQEMGTDYAKLPSPFLWMIGLWQHRMGNSDRLDSIKSVYDQRAGQGSRIDSLLGSGATALITLSRGDTTGAIQMLADLAPTGPHQRLIWDPWESLGPERLLLSQLLLDRRLFLEAAAVSSYLESPAAVPYVVNLRSSLTNTD